MGSVTIVLIVALFLSTVLSDEGNEARYEDDDEVVQLPFVLFRLVRNYVQNRHSVVQICLLKVSMTVIVYAVILQRKNYSMFK